MGEKILTVFIAGQKAVAEGLPKEFLGVPFIIGEDGRPDQLINEYLLARRPGRRSGGETGAGGGPLRPPGPARPDDPFASIPDHRPGTGERRAANQGRPR